jgi:hypothetical protein
MAKEIKQPTTIIEQMVIGQQVTNDNIIALAEDLNIMHTKLDALLAMFTTPAISTDNSKPVASGEETK